MKYNKKKLKNAVLYIAKYGGSDVGKKKLAKILYFIDFTLYELRKESMTGMSYVKMDFGPMPEPKVFYSALDQLSEDKVIEIKKPNSYKLERILSKSVPDMEVFDKKEKEIIQQMVEKYRLESAGNLERLAQSEAPYKMVKYSEKIPYHLAFYRNSFGGMDLDD